MEELAEQTDISRKGRRISFMEKDYNKSIILSVLLAFAAIVGVITFFVAKGTDEDFVKEVKGSEAYIFGFEPSQLVTKEMASEPVHTIPDEFKTILRFGEDGMEESEKKSLNAMNDVTYNDAGTSKWGALSNGWMMYAIGDQGSFATFEDSLIGITGKTKLRENIEVDQNGWIGLSTGGYRAGTITAGGEHYLIMQYYVDGWGTCAFVTLDPNAVNNGKEILDKNVLCYIDDESVMTGTDFSEDGLSEEEIEFIKKEIDEGAKYCYFTVDKDFEKMRLLFSTEYFSRIKELYIRDIDTDSITYPSEEEEHDEEECVFVIDNVHNGQTFQIVIFADKDPGEPEFAAVEYNESATVKNRQAQASETISGNEEETSETEETEEQKTESSDENYDIIEVTEN